MKRSTQLRFLRLEGSQEHLELHRLDCLSSHRDLTNYRAGAEDAGDTPKEEIKPPPLFRGNDLIAQGYSPDRFKIDPPGGGGRPTRQANTQPR